MTYLSHATITQSNASTLMELLRQADPDLFLLKQTLTSTRITPLFLPRLLRAMDQVLQGTHFGQIRVFIQDNRITQIRGEQTDKLDVEALLSDETI